MRLGIVWLMSVLVVTGCSNESAEVPETSPTPDSTGTPSTATDDDVLPCQDMIGNDEDVPEDYEILLDVVALPTANSSPNALQVGRRDGTDQPDYFAKTGLLVRSGAAFDLEVEHPDTAGLGWGSPAAFSSSISSQGCQGESWLAFAGGFLVQDPTCVRLTLTTDDDQRVFFVGAGAACQGQQPPSPN